MAIAANGSAGTGSANSATSSIAVACTSAVGEVLLVAVALDNVQTTDGASTLVASVTDAVGNTYTKIGEFTNGNGAAAAGATVGLWVGRQVTALAAQNVTVSTAPSTPSAKAVSVHRFTVAAGKSLQLAGTVQTLANDAADPGSLALSGLASKEYLFVRVVAGETSAVTAMTGTNYTAFTAATSSGGATATNMACRALYRVLTGTGDTLDPTFAAVDCASLYAALEEFTVPVTGTAAATLPMLARSASGTVAVAGAGASTLPMLTGSAAGTGPPPSVVDRYVDTASTAGGDGTTSATTGANRAYVSLNAALTALQATDWQAANQRPVIHCAASAGAADTATASISSTWLAKLSATCYLEIIGDQPNALQYSTADYRIEPPTNASAVSNAGAQYLRVSRIAAKATADAAAGGFVAVNLSVAVDVRLDRLNVWGVIDAAKTSNVVGIQNNSATAGSQVTVTNACVHGFKTGGQAHKGIVGGTSSGAMTVYNSSVIDCQIGLLANSGTDITAKNTGTTGCPDGWSGTFNAASDYNASSIAADAPGSNSRNSVTPTFVDAAGGDYHLDLGDTAWKDFGADLSADSVFPFSTDGDGETRTGTWDIGADENLVVLISGAGASALPMLTGSAAGAVAVSGAGASTLPVVTQSAAGAVAVSGAGASTLPMLTSAASGSVAVTGAGDSTVPMLLGAADGTVVTPPVTGDGASTVPMLTSSASGTVAVTGSSDSTLPMLTSAAAGEAPETGAGAAQLPMLSAAASGTVAVQGAAAATLPMLAPSASGTVPVTGAGASTIPMLIGVASSGATAIGEAANTVPMLTSAASGQVVVGGAGASTLPMLTSEAAGTEAVVGAAPAVIPMLTSSASGAVAVTGSGDSVLPMLVQSGAGGVPTVGEAAGTIPMLTSGAFGSVAVVGSAESVLPMLSSAAAGAIATKVFMVEPFALVGGPRHSVPVVGGVRYAVPVVVVEEAPATAVVLRKA